MIAGRVRAAAGALLACRDLGNGPTGPATPITAPTLSGAPYDLVVDAWARRGPRLLGIVVRPVQRDEQPDLNKLCGAVGAERRGLPRRGQDRNPSANGAAYERTYNVAYPSVNDASEVIASEYNVSAPPTVIIVDAKGNIVDRFLGTLSGVSADLTRLT